MGGLFFQSDVPIFAAMVATECSNVVQNTLFKAATAKGMSSYVFVFYSYAIAAFLLLPAPFLSKRSRESPPLSFSILSKIGVLGLIGCAYLNMGYIGLLYSTPTLASAVSNLTPALTFILAVIFRMEKLSFRKASGMAKVLGTMVSITGAFVVTLYKGLPIIIPSQPSASLHQPLSPSLNSDWAIGGAFLAVEYTLVSISSILMAHIMKDYPTGLMVTFLYCVFVSFLSAIVSLIAEMNNPKAWRIRPDIALVCIIFAGLGSCGCCAIRTWAVRRKGPVFVALFKPLSIAIAVVMGAVFLGDSLYLGSLIGATLISFGFYTVMWGKASEEKGQDCVDDDLESPDTRKVPLLKGYKDELV